MEKTNSTHLPICKSLRVPSVVLLHVIAIHHHSERDSNGPMARITPRSQDSEIDIQQPAEGGNPITGYKLAKAGCGSVHSCKLSRQVGFRAIRLGEFTVQRSTPTPPGLFFPRMWPILLKGSVLYVKNQRK